MIDDFDYSVSQNQIDKLKLLRLKNDLEEAGSLKMVVGSNKYHIYSELLYYYFITDGIIGMDMTSSKEFLVDRYKLIKIFCNAYDKGVDSLSKDLNIDNSVLYGVNGNRFIEDFKNKYYKGFFGFPIEGWVGVKHCYPRGIDKKKLERFGYYSGVVRTADNFMYQRSSFFNDDNEQTVINQINYIKGKSADYLYNLNLFQIYTIVDGSREFNNDSVITLDNWDKSKDDFLSQRLATYKESLTNNERILLEIDTVNKIEPINEKFKVLKLRYLDLLNNQSKDNASGNFTDMGWFQVGLLFATGEIEDLIVRFNGNGTHIAKHKFPKKPSKYRSYITESISKNRDSDKNIFNYPDKIKAIINYCNKLEINVIDTFTI